MLFVGSEKDLESSILARHQLEHRPLPVESLATLKRHPFRFLTRNWRASRAARQLIRETSPTAVIGLGGYASAPIVWAATRRGIPIVLLEQNAIPGRTTRWLARSAAVVCSSFPEAARYLLRAKRIEITGNPVRQDIAALANATTRPDSSRKELLILGGSQGADSLNDAVVAAVSRLKDELSGWRVVHQTGPRLAESIRATYQQRQIDAIVEPFFDDMAERYQVASLVVSRAGATTLAELTCCGLPMILLPYPHAADDHQRANASSLKDRHAACIVEHGTNTVETTDRLVTQLKSLLADEAARTVMGQAAKAAAIPNAASNVADLIESVSRH
jgi:UDP-N-acetylglucosamine--N-acetylmuramyl-(pentapeptide) pyrophosphoryl-undecaprenol N-acetylglucosamine transferase